MNEKNGEVMIPAWLIVQMMDKLEEFYHVIFKNKNILFILLSFTTFN